MCHVCGDSVDRTTGLCMCGGRTSLKKENCGSAWVAFLSDGQRAYPVCVGRTEEETLHLGRQLVGDKDSYFISVYCVPIQP